MVRKYMIPVLALVGILFALWMVRQGSKPVIHAEPVADPPHVEFANRISGTGIVEASSRNISIGAHLPGIVARVHVKVGERVRAGSPLFSIDDRARLADLAVREARVREAEANLQDLRASSRLPRRSRTPGRSARTTSTSAALQPRRPRPAWPTPPRRSKRRGWTLTC